MRCKQRGDVRLRGLLAGLLVGGLVLPRLAHADPGLRLGLGLMFAASIPDGPSKPALGAPWYLRGEVRGISRVDPVGTVGDRPARGHVALYDSFFLEAGIGAICTKTDCASLGDVHLRGVGGYELLGGYRSPESSQRLLRPRCYVPVVLPPRELTDTGLRTRRRPMIQPSDEASRPLTRHPRSRRTA